MESIDSLWSPWIPYGVHKLHMESKVSIWSSWIPYGRSPWIPYSYSVHGFHMESMDSYGVHAYGIRGLQIAAVGSKWSPRTPNGVYGIQMELILLWAGGRCGGSCAINTFPNNTTIVKHVCLVEIVGHFLQKYYNGL